MCKFNNNSQIFISTIIGKDNKDTLFLLSVAPRVFPSFASDFTSWLLVSFLFPALHSLSHWCWTLLRFTKAINVLSSEMWERQSSQTLWIEAEQCHGNLSRPWRGRYCIKWEIKVVNSTVLSASLITFHLISIYQWKINCFLTFGAVHSVCARWKLCKPPPLPPLSFRPSIIIYFYINTSSMAARHCGKTQLLPLHFLILLKAFLFVFLFCFCFGWVFSTFSCFTTWVTSLHMSLPCDFTCGVEDVCASKQHRFLTDRSNNKRSQR